MENILNFVGMVVKNTICFVLDKGDKAALVCAGLAILSAMVMLALKRAPFLLWLVAIAFFLVIGWVLVTAIRVGKVNASH